METHRINIIAALGARTRSIGKNNTLLWRIPDDLKRFKALTSGHPIIMGRKTYESIGRPLPDRTNIIITRNPSYAAAGCTVVSSLAEAIIHAKGAPGNEEIFIIGGGEIYKEALSTADRLYLTLVDSDAEGDAFFPDYSTFKRIIANSHHEFEDLKYSFVTLEK